MDTEQIAQITVSGKSEGMDKVKSDLEGVTKAQGDLAQQSTATATVTETTAKKQLDASTAYDRLHNSLDAAAGSTAAFEKRQTVINNALGQGHITQAQAAADIALLAERYPKAAASADILAAKTSFLSGAFSGNAAAGTKSAEIAALLEARQLGLASSVGLVGEVMAVIGPVGLAAAVGIGAAVVALDYLVVTANKFGESSIGIRNFSDATGLTTTEVRGLSEAAEKAGISGDRITSSFERFTANLEPARTGTGALFLALQKISAPLADEIAHARSGADAWDIMAKAINSTTDATHRGALAKAAFGRGGVADVPVLIATDNAGGIKAYSDEVQKATGITDELTRHTAQLKGEIDATKKLTANVYASIYSDDVLERQATFEKAQLRIAQSIKNSTVSASAYGGPSTDEFGNPFDFTLLNQNKTPKGTPAALSAADSPAAGFGETAAIEATKALATANRDAGDAELYAANQLKRLISGMGNAADATQKLELKQLELQMAYEGGAFGAPDSSKAMKAAAAAQDQLNIDNESAQAIDRQRAAVTELASQYGDVSQKTAATLATQEAQLAIAKATTGEATLQAQADAQRLQLELQGSDAPDLIAANQMAIIQAGIDKSIASQVTSLQQSTALLNSGMDPVVQAAQAYANAMAKGASSTEAAALAAATLANNEAKAAAASDKIGFGAASGGGLNFGGTGGGSDTWAGTKGGAPVANQQQIEQANRAYGPNGVDWPILGGGSMGHGFNYYSMPQPNAQGLQFQQTQQSNGDIQYMLQQAEQGMDAVSKAMLEAGVSKAPNAQSIVDKFLAEGNNAASVLAQKAAKQFLDQYGDTSGTSASLISPLYLSTSGYTGLGFNETNSIAGQRLTQSNQPSVGGGTGGGTSPYINTTSMQQPLSPNDPSIYSFSAASGMDFTVPGNGPDDTIPVKGMVRPGERLIAIPPGGQAPSQDNQSQRQSIVIHMPIYTNNEKQAVASRSQLAAAGNRMAAAIRMRG